LLLCFIAQMRMLTKQGKLMENSTAISCSANQGHPVPFSDNMRSVPPTCGLGIFDEAVVAHSPAPPALINCLCMIVPEEFCRESDDLRKALKRRE